MENIIIYIKEKMDKDNFIAFEKDYHVLHCMKEVEGAWSFNYIDHPFEKEIWNRNISYDNPIFKELDKIIYADIFRSLSNRYDYIVYRKLCHDRIGDILNRYCLKQYNISEFCCFWYRFTIGTYIGFIVEQVLRENLPTNNKIMVNKRLLDIRDKVDIFYNNIPYQIKNISFLRKETTINEYKVKYPYLHFIFYKAYPKEIAFQKTYDNSCIISCKDIYLCMGTLDTDFNNVITEISSKKDIDYKYL